MCKKGVNNEYKGGETFYSLLKIKEKYRKPVNAWVVKHLISRMHFMQKRSVYMKKGWTTIQAFIVVSNFEICQENSRSQRYK